MLLNLKQQLLYYKFIMEVYLVNILHLHNIERAKIYSPQHIFARSVTCITSFYSACEQPKFLCKYTRHAVTPPTLQKGEANQHFLRNGVAVPPKEDVLRKSPTLLHLATTYTFIAC